MGDGRIEQKVRPAVRIADDLSYVEFEHGAPMREVVLAIRATEASGRIVFDLLDAGLWAEMNGRTRIYGIYKKHLIG